MWQKIRDLSNGDCFNEMYKTIVYDCFWIDVWVCGAYVKRQYIDVLLIKWECLFLLFGFSLKIEICKWALFGVKIRG